MSELVGKPFPEGITFTYVAPTPEKSEVTACGIPIKFEASKELKDKKAVIVAVPGAFTPTCQADHLSGYIKKLDELKKGGVDLLIFIAYNDPFVMSAWGKANGITDDKIVSHSLLIPTYKWTKVLRRLSFAWAGCPCAEGGAGTDKAEKVSDRTSML